jgi:hypothetical protein
MPNTPVGMRVCPTRVDGVPVLFAHVIDVADCQQHQRRHFHKCPTCTFCNARTGLPSGAPDVVRPQLATRTNGVHATNGHAVLRSPVAGPE